MLAAIDVGSNTLRMLIGTVSAGHVRPACYYRRVTRLGGGFILGKGLAPEGMERTISALKDFSRTLAEKSIADLRVVGTAALRRAANRQAFISQLKTETGLDLEVISGSEEARLSAAGVLAVISPVPPACLIMDIGGGSTEFIFCREQQVLFQQSYPLGVVRLSEEAENGQQRLCQIDRLLGLFLAEIARQGYAALLTDCELIGTAGTMTTLAAMKLRMVNYDWRRINNQILPRDWLRATRESLLPLSLAEREALPGLEEGRADLIIPGLEILIALTGRLSHTQIKVADSGLLEGLLLERAKGA